jgi:hypothetical protein
MDELARRYLLLGLRLARISPGLLDSYVGPPELREIALGEPVPFAAELHDEAMTLAEMADRLPGTDAETALRRAWFAGQLRAMSALARRAAGEEIAYLDLVEELTGVRVATVADRDLLAARGRLEAALPGPGALHDRIAGLRAALRIPADRVVDAVRGSAGRFRTASRRDFDLPDGETIEWGEAHDQPWGAYAEYIGSRRTRILVNVDLPMDVSGAAFLASHEAYPGHHAEHVIKDVTLIRGAGLGEATLRTMGTPEAVLSEGLADVAREVVMSDRELEAELRRIGRELGIDGDWAAAVVVRGAFADLQRAQGNAGIMLHHEGRREGDVRAYLADVGMVPADRLDHVMRVLRDPVGGMVFPYTEGAALIRPWLELQGQTSGFWRLLSEQLSPAVLKADLDADRSPVGGAA